MTNVRSATIRKFRTIENYLLENNSMSLLREIQASMMQEAGY